MSSEFMLMPDEELDSALRRASAHLAEAGIDQAEADAQLLVAHLLEQETGEVISRGRVQALALVGASVPVGYEKLVSLRAERIPLQHLTGVAYFRSLKLSVGPGVFIPRPETELLVEHALGRVDRLRSVIDSPIRILDLCTGSGAIAAALATERHHVDVTAVELSDLAYAWAERNLQGTGVRLVQADARDALEGEEGSYDIVVSNPPYIPENAIPCDVEVREHDPHMALYGGSEDGMRIPRAIASRAFELLKPGGYCIMEHAQTQREVMVETFESLGFNAIESIDDLASRARHTAGEKPNYSQNN
ncbi:peptide chain release factor N(5)-glutamine methyltransferase [Rothia sp. P7208]|uniref:peptide chain release factor N(5)-glutamine methyltransferase n=1 Tax=Rothia sp. P7208 TaxID=3402660 RepID=UPI003ACF8B3D